MLHQSMEGVVAVWRLDESCMGVRLEKKVNYQDPMPKGSFRSERVASIIQRQAMMV
jgi:hypothetical protein